MDSEYPICRCSELINKLDKCYSPGEKLGFYMPMFMLAGIFAGVLSPFIYQFYSYCFVATKLHVSKNKDEKEKLNYN